MSAVCLHGDMAQERRSFILKGFQEGRYEVIVSTGVLARGLVLPNVQQAWKTNYNHHSVFTAQMYFFVLGV